MMQIIRENNNNNTPDPTLLSSQEKASQNLPFLYEVNGTCEKTGEKVRFYLVGSQHNVPAQYLEGAILELADTCDVLVKEITYDVFGDAGDISLKELKLHGLVAASETEDWTKHLSEEATQYFDRFIKDQIETVWGIKSHQMSPVVVNHVVSEWGVSHSYGVGLDRAIMDQFEDLGKPVVALEDGKIRFDANDTLFGFNDAHTQYSLLENAKMLESTILERTQAAPIFSQEKSLADFADYFSGDIETVSSSGELREIQKRNLAWMAAMEKYLGQFHGKKVVFMFGYAHLAGNYGILKLLRNLGYEVNRINHL